eukprot:CAMPEP_0194538068 /NCGR_PEP_ID=MMETSP0253-20130528/77519_1 /TAXON_ID=2966 /ORGANISM="Noctiluca scintillans" /LENGTH=53 /DNA_ID=CAMNT_0039384141 /DNA_START=120 /DNA_END=278 /DNA_ORIENTATION=+
MKEHPRHTGVKGFLNIDTSFPEISEDKHDVASDPRHKKDGHKRCDRGLRHRRQ